MSRVLLVLVALGLVTPLALAQEEDPFADANETSEEEEDPFATYEQRRNETFQAQQNETSATDTEETETDATATSTATPTASPTPEATPAADTPGFGVAALVGAVGAALVVLRRRP